MSRRVATTQLLSGSPFFVCRSAAFMSSTKNLPVFPPCLAFPFTKKIPLPTLPISCYNASESYGCCLDRPALACKLLLDQNCTAIYCFHEFSQAWGFLPMAIPATSIIHAEIIMQGLIASGGSNAVPTQFIFQYRRTSTAVAPDKAALATAFQTAVGIPIIAMLNARWSEQFVSVRWINDALDQALPFTNVNVGGVAGDSLASHVAGFMLFRTGIKGRSYRGGKHFGPFSEADVTTAGDDVFNAAAIVRLTSTATALATSIVDSTPNTWKLCIYSRVLSQSRTNPTTIVANDVATILINKRVANMKRRQVNSVY